MTAYTDLLSIYPSNPHYFMYNGQPVLLIASDHHYGAVVNEEFDYIAYLDKLRSKGQNFTRIYPGAFIEKENDFVNGNVLGIRDGKQILPWAKTVETGAHPVLGGYKYDLDQWNTAYFDRLKDFCAAAQEREIFVEICFFNGMYPQRWQFQAMHQTNNIQSVGACAFDMVQSLTGDAKLVLYQEKYVAEIARQLNVFGNLIFHICDEPWIGREQPPSIYGAWISRMIDVFRDSENNLPRKHLLGQTVDFVMRNSPADFSGDSRIDYIDIEYVRGAKDLENEYDHNKPIVFIESSYYPVYNTDDAIGASRVEAWEFMIGGCAGFMQLNGLYSTFNPAAKDTEIDTVLDIFVKLQSFMQTLSFHTMKRDNSFIRSGAESGFGSALSEPGKQYAFYIHHSRYQDPPPVPHDGRSYCHNYVTVPGSYRETLTFDLAAGTYKAEWVNPGTGAIICADIFTHNGGNRAFITPTYSIDLALRMMLTFNR